MTFPPPKTDSVSKELRMPVELNIFTRKAEAKKEMSTLDIFSVKKSKLNTTETDSGNSAVDSSVSNVSDTCVVSSVISEAVTNNNSAEGCVHHTFPSYWKKEQWLQKLNENEW
jgi:hypothetical protein